MINLLDSVDALGCEVRDYLCGVEPPPSTRMTWVGATCVIPTDRPPRNVFGNQAHSKLHKIINQLEVAQKSVNPVLWQKCQAICATILVRLFDTDLEDPEISDIRDLIQTGLADFDYFYPKVPGYF